MITVLRVLAWIFVLVGAAIGGLWLFGPREPVDLEISFDPESLPADLDSYLAASESGVANLRPQAAKRIHWQGAVGEKTPLSVVYLHGFSASLGEIQPVPDRVAAALGANLHFTRLVGHGQDGPAMATATAGDWIEDTAEALAIGRRIGDRVLVISTSTGGTLAALAALDPALSADLAGIVFVSPNFRIGAAGSFLLTAPLVRHWGPLIMGEARGFDPVNPEQERFWTTRYPSVSVLPMAALVAHVRGLDLSAAETPALFLYSQADQVVDPSAIETAHGAWGGPKRIQAFTMGQGDDRSAHVIAGDIVSPGQTEAAVAAILDWAADL